MGVRGLETFVREEVPDGYQSVNILTEITNFREKNDVENPIIIFDMMGMIHSLGGSFTELLCGGRHNMYLDKIEEFFKKLKNAGAKLVMFCDGQLQTLKVDEWCRRRDNEYMDFFKFMNQIDRDDTSAKVITRYERPQTCKTVAGSVIQIARQYGRVIISTDFDCDAAVAQYAVRNKALAVVASDTDNLIFEGNWQYWHCLKINFDSLNVKRYGRKQLMNHLQLTRTEMRILATILGTDYLKNVKFKKWFGAPKAKAEYFKNISDYVRSLHVDDTRIGDSLYKRIYREVICPSQNMDKTIEMIRNSICSYNIDVDVRNVEDKLELYAIENVLMSAILYNGIFQYDVNLTDFSTENNNISTSFIVAILPVFRRLAGVLLQHEIDVKPYREIRIITKLAYDKNYELIRVQPFYPETQIPPLADLIEDDFEEEFKWDIFIWALSLNDITPEQIQDIPTNYLIVLLALRFLIQEKQISLPEADAILLTEHAITNHTYNTCNVKEPDFLNGRAIRVAHLYNKTVVLIWDCLHICGFRKYIQNFMFDGFYFHSLMNGGLQKNKMPSTLLQLRKFYEF